jgi:uncharacterized protein (DUF1778 family)
MAGRKKKEDGAGRTERVELRLSATERALLSDRADAAGVSVSEYARRVILDIPLTFQAVKKADPALIVALNRVGVNLNQIARVLNTDQRGERAECLPRLEEALWEVSEALERLMDLEHLEEPEEAPNLTKADKAASKTAQKDNSKDKRGV